MLGKKRVVPICQYGCCDTAAPLGKAHVRRMKRVEERELLRELAEEMA
jgi:hypothetical protein